MAAFNDAEANSNNIENESMDSIEVTIIHVNNVSTVYRIGLQMPAGSVGSISSMYSNWHLIRSYDEMRSFKQELKKMGVRMAAPFPNQSIMKTITTDDLVPLTLWVRELLSWESFKNYPGSVQMFLSASLGSPKGRELGDNLYKFRTDVLLMGDQRRISGKQGGNENGTVDTSGDSKALEAPALAPGGGGQLQSDASSVYSGWLVKRGHIRKNWLRRYCVIGHDGTLCYYSDESRKRRKGCIQLAQYWLAFVGDEGEEAEDGAVGFVLHQTHTDKVYSSYHFRICEDVSSPEQAMLGWRDALLFDIGLTRKPYVAEIGWWS